MISVRVKVYPADMAGCGHFRMVWPTRVLQAAGHDVELVMPGSRDFSLKIDRETDRVEDVLGRPEEDADVVVLQRITHPWMAQAVPILRSKGIAVVMDMDDDLNAIDPHNPAFAAMHPARTGEPMPGGRKAHSWKYLAQACGEATLVTVSTPALLKTYAGHGRGHLLPNCLPDTYFRTVHTDSGVIGWPAALASHPNDPEATGGALARLVADGADFRICGDPVGTGAAFGLPGMADPPGRGRLDLAQWPQAVADIGIGIAPLADTRFNAAKSWLKPLEMSACGVPWVGSPRAEYARLHALGAGRLADTPRRWHRELVRLRDSEAARRELGESGRAAVDHLRIERQAWTWWEAWTRALEIQRGHSSSDTPRNRSDRMPGSTPSGTSSSISTDLPSVATV